MSHPSSDRNLLFGILALQMDFITRDQLIQAMNAWTVEKSKSLGEILVARGALNASDLALLSPLVDRHVEQHGGDARMSLAALSSLDSARRPLEQISDADVQASLAIVGTLRQHPDDAEATLAPPTVGEPTSAGTRFRILRPHDKGGLGQVSVALDQELNREVALKEIQDRFADKPESRARFLLEAEVTGGLEHPGIVPVYGLGTYADGRPFYAMRFIRGDNLQRAIERYHKSGARFDSLDFRQLLGRFIDVCNAVAYAHSRSVLHRDLKPGNIMLGKYGETLVVDWGLAKPLERAESASASSGDEPPLRPTATSGTAETLPGSAVGTPQYMSPEQAAGRWDEIGPTTDVYSLGATLYELMTGKAPIAKGELNDMMRRVEKGDIAAPRNLNAAVPRALEAVCLKAMALTPADRYGSALEVAKEIEHWLADESVMALREPIAARARRWVRKHSRLTTGIAAALIVSLLGFGLGLYLVNAERGRTELARQDEEKQRIEAQKERDRANENLAYARKGNELLGSVFAKLNPKRIAQSGRPLQDLLKDNLNKAVQELEGTAIGDRLAVADMQTTLGISLFGLGQYQQAATVFEKVRETRLVNLGLEHPDTLQSMNNLSNIYAELGRHREALTLREETLKLRKAKLGPDHPDTLASVLGLTNSYYVLGRHAEALALEEETLKHQKAKFGPDHPDTLRNMNNLALSYHSLGRLSEALALFQETLKLTKAKFGPDHTETLQSMNNLAASYAALGRHAEALALYEETIKLVKAKLGPDHPDTLRSMHNLAASYTDLGRYPEALVLNEETLKLRKAKLGPDHPDTLRSMSNLASTYLALGRHAEALAVEEKTLKLQNAKLGPDHADTLLSMNNLAEFYVTVNRADEAIALIDDALPRAVGKAGGHAGLVPSLIDNRLRAMAKKRDPAGCRVTAEMREKLNRTDADSLYSNASFRAICAVVMREKKEAGADEQADKAMHWLKRAVTAGYKDVEHMKRNKDLDALREREDFKKLIAEVEAAAMKPTKPAKP